MSYWADEICKLIDTTDSNNIIKPNYPPVGCNIFHYTSPDGFMGIFNGAKLHFTQAHCLNDYSEGQYIKNMYEQKLKSMYEKNQISLEFYDLICYETITKASLWSPFFEIKKGHFVRKQCDTYICCFSQNSDSLPMWNYYSKNNRYEGFNIGFNVHQLEEILSAHSIPINFFKVVYSSNEQRLLLQKVVETAYSRWETNSILNHAIELIVNYLFQWKYMFKAPCFEHEDEVRAIFHIPNDELELEKFKVEYRTHRGIIVPYIALSFEENKNCITKITIGPCKTETEYFAQHTASKFLKSKGIHAYVLNSNIPIRY